MKLGIITAAALALTASAANAGWTGCKIGGIVGAAATVTEMNVSSPSFPGDSLFLDGFGAQGAQGGVSIGCDYQMGSIVVGAFADYVMQDVEWSAGATFGGDTYRLSTTMEDQWSVGGRIGYLVTPTTLAYALAAYTEAKGGAIGLTENGVSLGSVDLGDFKGWSVGGGIETEVAKRIYLTAEYRYSRFDSRGLSIDLGPTVNVDLETDSHVARLGIAFKFGPDDPIQPMK